MCADTREAKDKKKQEGKKKIRKIKIKKWRIAWSSGDLRTG